MNNPYFSFWNAMSIETLTVSEIVLRFRELQKAALDTQAKVVAFAVSIDDEAYRKLKRLELYERRYNRRKRTQHER